MIKRVLTLDNALSITSRILINDDAGASTGGTTVPAKLGNTKPLPTASLCPEQHEGTRPTPREAGRGTCFSLHGSPSEVVVVAVTSGRFDGFAEGSPKSLAPGSGSCVS